MDAYVLQAAAVFLAGILAGEEFIVRYGVQPALSRLEDHSHLLARQALVRQLRWVVPAIMLPTVVVTILVLVFAGTGTGSLFRWLGAATLLAFVLFSFLGTVPINIKVNDWDVSAPPAEWKAVVQRWQTIDVFRSSAAILTFALLLIGFAVAAAV